MIREVIGNDALNLLGYFLAFAALKLNAHLHSQHAQRRSTRGS
jgi:hypothetical protein